MQDITSSFQAGYIGTIPFLILFSCATLFIFTQIYIIRHAKKSWIGLILPAIFFLVSMRVVLENLTTLSYWQTAADTILYTLLTNIPTAILLLIYVLNPMKKE